MLTTKKISSIEFRLHNKIFNNDFSPQNYFEKYRFEVVFRRLLFWFYYYYGFYFLLQKIKLINEYILLQIYYYKFARSFHLRFFKVYSENIVSIGNLVSVEKKNKILHLPLHFYKKKYIYKKNIFIKNSLISHELLVQTSSKKIIFTSNIKYKQKILKKIKYILIKLLLKKYLKNLYKIKNKYFIKTILTFKKLKIDFFLKYKFLNFLLFKNYLKNIRILSNKKELYNQLNKKYLDLQKKKKNIIRFSKKSYSFKKIVKKQKYYFFNLFFKYFWQHYFKLDVISLYKSLFRFSLCTKLLKYEFKQILHQTHYISRRYKNWGFDFLFFFNYYFTFYNSNFLLPLFTNYLKTQRNPKYLFKLFINLLKLIYAYKGSVQAIRFLVHGVIRRAARTRKIIFNIGVFTFTSTESNILFDTIQCPIRQGAISLKLWIYLVPADISHKQYNTNDILRNLDKY